MRLFFCGDIMPGGVLPYQTSYIDSDLLRFMSQFDFRIGTLECAIGNGLPYDEVKMRGRMNIIYARNEDLFRIKEMGFDVVSLANNHVWDMGEDGLRNTMRQLDELGIQYCGAGMNIEEASRPAVVKRDGATVAFLAYCMYNNPWLGYVETADSGKAGVCPLDIDRVVEDIREAKRNYDKVIVLPHWGKENSYKPMSETIDMAKRMIKSGADAIMGSHSHQVQPLVRLHGIPVCFSMGNFLFPDFYMQPPRPMWYPDAMTDLMGIPNVEHYDFPVKEYVKRVWEPVSRYGRAVGLTIGERGMTVDSYFTHTSLQNIVSRSSISSDMKRHLWKESGNAKYGLFRRLTSGILRVKKHLVRGG